MRDHDYAASIDFLARFFSGTEHAVEIRALPVEAGAGRVWPLFCREPDLITAHCLRWDALGRAMYFGCATRAGGLARGDRVHCRELVACWVDIDCYKQGITKEEAVAALLALPVPPSIVVDSGGGIHAYWLLREPIDISQSVADWPAVELRVVSVLKQLAGVLAGDLAVCDLARIMRLPGTHNTKDGTLRPCFVLPCSTWARVALDDLEDMLAVQRPLLTAPAGAAVVLDGGAVDNPWAAYAKAFTWTMGVDVRARLDAMQYRGTSPNSIHETRRSVSSSLAARGVPDDEILTLLLAETHRVAALAGMSSYWNWAREEKTIRAEIASADRKFAPGTGTRRRDEANAPPPRNPGNVVELRSGGPRAAADDTQADPLPAAGEYVQNDIGNAFALIEQHGRDLRYVLGTGWHTWDGKRYAADTEGVVAQRMAHGVSAKMLSTAAAMPASKARLARAKWALASGNKSRIGGMLDQARSYIHCTSDALDADPMLLNCRNGTVNLHLGSLRDHSRDDLLTKLCPVNYDPAAPCPIWERFLSEIFDGDASLVAFVQRAIGYSLTGCTHEQVIFIMYGAGSNGKSVLLETIAAVLADYVKQSPAETWISKPYSGISNDIAALAGTRFVSVIETEHDKSLAEALVKQATGGDAMTARFLHREFFSFVPKFKLWFATNHKPKIRGSDYAIWRRILLLPFAVTFVDADKLTEGQRVKDPDLKTKLADEYPGILAWMIRGCLSWQNDGLAAPDAVRSATESYQNSQDNVSSFIRDTCHISRGLTCTIGLLYAAYEIWCEESDEIALSKTAFGRNLDDRGYPPGSRSNRERLRKGIDIKEEYRIDATNRQNAG